MKTIYTDDVMLNTKGPNQSFGNHVLHLYGVWKIAKTLGIDFSIGVDSNLDEMFILDSFKGKGTGSPSLIFVENYGGDLYDHIPKEEQNNTFISSLLSNKIEVPSDFYLNGWLFNSKLLPDSRFFEDIKIRESLICEIDDNFSYIKGDSNVVIHYRGTDFSNHSIGWGDLRLREEYYESCLENFSIDRKIEKVILVSDEIPDFLLRICQKYSSDISIEKNNYLIDWLILLFSRNLICSNSSFCYTAGWYNKNIVYQPRGFLARYIDQSLSYPLYPYYQIKNSIII